MATALSFFSFHLLLRDNRGYSLQVCAQVFCHLAQATIRRHSVLSFIVSIVLYSFIIRFLYVSLLSFGFRGFLLSVFFPFLLPLFISISPMGFQSYISHFELFFDGNRGQGGH